MGSATYNYTGSWQTFGVPTGVTVLNVTVTGAAGYGNVNSGRVIGTLSVADTDTLYIAVGQNGKPGATGSVHTQAGGAAPYSNGGAGGDGYNAQGGDSGGGASFIRLNSTAGSIKCVAAGGAGNSGDAGAGGAGGYTAGISGARGNAGSGSTVNATGGSQTAPGQGGTSSSGSTFAGGDAYNGVLGRAGSGGSTGGLDGPGGGGGGGGYFSGGGGQAGSTGWAPGGGGGGGSNFIGNMRTCTTNDRNGGSGNGQVVITWTDPDQPPPTPNITSPAPATRTSDISSTPLTATVSAPPLGSTQTRLYVQYDTDINFGSYQSVFSGYRSTSGSLTVNLTGLANNSYYYVRVYAQGDSGLDSTGRDTTSFYTDYAPGTPTNVGPSGATRSMGGVTLTAKSTDPDGDTYKINFQYDDNSSFSSPTTVSSATVASGSTATKAITGLLTDKQYWVRAQAQDTPGLTSAYSASVNFWTNRTPTAPTLTQPFNGEVFDSTVAQTFTWTFNDPDSGDTQSAATLQYRPVGGPTWTQVTATTQSTYTFAANTFTSGVTYEWQVQTTDAGGLTGPFSASNTFVGSPPLVNMSATGGMTINGVDTVSRVSAMSASAALSVTPHQTESSTVSMSASASMTVTPVQTITLPLALSARSGMTINTVVTHLPSLALGASASLSVNGSKSIPGSITFGASAGLLFQSVSADVLMQATSGMTIVANALNHQGAVAMGATGDMQVGPALTHSPSVIMNSSAGMSVVAVVSTQSAVGMVARASVSDSGSLSRIIPMSMSVRAQMSVDADPEHPGTVAMSARTGMSILGFANHPGAVAIAAQAGMAIAGYGTIDSGGVAMGAAAAVNITGYRSFTGAVAMGASAGIGFSQTQFTLDAPYLIDVDSHGDTLTLTRNSDPVPSKVSHKVTVTNIGSVQP